MKRRRETIALITKELGQHIEAGCIHIPTYTEKDYRKLIVKPRSIFSMNRRTSRRNKPIKLQTKCTQLDDATNSWWRFLMQISAQYFYFINIQTGGKEKLNGEEIYLNRQIQAR